MCPSCALRFTEIWQCRWGSPTCQNHPHISPVFYQHYQPPLAAGCNTSRQLWSWISIVSVTAAKSQCLVMPRRPIEHVEQPSRKGAYTIKATWCKPCVSKGFFHPASSPPFCCWYIQPHGMAVVASLVSGTMTSGKLLHPITLPEGQPHVLESRGYDEAPTFAGFFVGGGWLSFPPWTTGQCWWTNPTWINDGFRAPYWRWEVTWAAAFLLITMNGRPLTAIFFMNGGHWWPQIVPKV